MGKKHAILISNSNYDNIEDFDLYSPDNDVAAIEKSLLMRGFTTEKYRNVNADKFEEIFTLLAGEARYELIFVYYSGHAIEINGKGFLLPTDLPNLSSYDVSKYVFSVGEILTNIHGAATIKIVALDSCRNRVDTWDSSDYVFFSNQVGQDPDIKSYQNVAITYSTSAGEAAYDGNGISLYAQHLSEYILKHRISIDDVFRNVGTLVSQTPPFKQRPWFYSSLNESLTFSDLPEYEFIHSLQTPINGLTSSLQLLNGKQILCGGRPSIFSLDSHGFQGIVRFEQEIVAVDYSNTTDFIFALADGGVVAKNMSYSPNFDFSNIRCLRISSDGRYTALIGAEECAFIDNKNNTAKKLSSQGDIFYSAIFIEDNILWIGGNNGMTKVCFDNGKISSSSIDIKDCWYVYSIEKIDNETFAISCGGGNVFVINSKSFEVKGVINLGETVRTVSARRESIINVTTNDEVVRQFLYKPWEMDKEGIDYLKAELSGNDLIFVKSSPVDPLLVVASDEGVIYFIDRRNFENYHSIVVGSFSNLIQGISFEPDGALLVLMRDGYVHFYSRDETDYRHATAYIDNIAN